MARRQVLEITCDRCGRSESQMEEEIFEARRMKPGEDGIHVLPEILIRYPAVEPGRIQFDDLCRRCRTAVQNYVLSIIKKKEESEEPKANGDTGVLGVGGKKTAERATPRGAS